MRSIVAAAVLRSSKVGTMPLAMRSHASCIRALRAGSRPVVSATVFMMMLREYFTDGARSAEVQPASRAGRGTGRTDAKSEDSVIEDLVRPHQTGAITAD